MAKPAAPNALSPKTGAFSTKICRRVADSAAILASIPNGRASPASKPPDGAGGVRRHFENGDSRAPQKRPALFVQPA